MLSVAATGRVFFATQPVDMRKGFNGLIGVVRSVLDEDPLSGDVFCFLNKRRSLMKILCFNGDGYVIYYKRLERGRFRSPVRDGVKGRRSWRWCWLESGRARDHLFKDRYRRTRCSR